MVQDAELGALKCKSPADLWTADLDQFLLDYEAYEADEERKASNQGPKAKGKKGLGKAQLKKKAASKRRKSWGARCLWRTLLVPGVLGVDKITGLHALHHVGPTWYPSA